MQHKPFFKGYRPQFYFRTTDDKGVIHLPEGSDVANWINQAERSNDLASKLVERMNRAVKEACKDV